MRFSTRKRIVNIGTNRCVRTGIFEIDSNLGENGLEQIQQARIVFTFLMSMKNLSYNTRLHDFYKELMYSRALIY